MLKAMKGERHTENGIMLNEKREGESFCNFGTFVTAKMSWYLS